MSGHPETIRVLHVDDSPDLVETAATFIEHRADRVDVTTATSASEALGILDTTHIDCLISDYDMPDMTGLELLARVRKDDPDLPFILFTGKGSEEIASEAIAQGVTDYLQKGRGTDQYDLLINRIENAVESYRAQQRANTLERIRTIVRDVNQALLRATTKAEIERRTCEIISDAALYQFAVIAGVDAETKHVEPRTWAGCEAGFLDDLEMAIDDGSAGRHAPGGRAFHERDIAVSQNIAEDPAYEPWRDAAIDHGFESLAVVPIDYDDHLYGLLAVYATRPYAFDDREQELLTELGGDLAHAMHAVDLRRELETYQTAVRNVPEGVFILDDDGVIELVNESGAALSGNTPDDLQGAPFPSLVEAGIFSEAVIEWYLATVPDLLSSATDRDEARFETELHTDDGDTRLVEIHLTLRPYDEEFRGTTGIIRDITAEKEHQRRLETLQQQTQALMCTPTAEETAEVAVAAAHDVLECPMIGFHVLSDDGHQLEPLAFVDTVREEFDGPPTYDRHADGDPAARLVWDAFERGEPLVIDDTHEYDDLATETPARSAIVHPLGEHGVLIVSAIEANAFSEADKALVDILAVSLTTALDRAERETLLRDREQALEQQNERLEEFASIVSHDLRNPLNVAQGRLELAQEEVDSDHLAAVERAHDRMEALIEDLLTLARERETRTDITAVDLADLAESCLQTVATAEATLFVDTDQTIQADPGQVRQLLENLIGNAVEHGGDDVRITIGELDTGFYVADDGPGIPPEHREQVFDAGYSTADAGTGFGLSIVEQIVDAHDWAIHVTECPDGGARFEMTNVDMA